MKVFGRGSNTLRGAALLVSLNILPFNGAAFTHQQVVPLLPTGTVQRIAFGSCAKQWQHQTIWEAVIAAKPDLFLFLGDAIYADTDGATAWTVTEEQLRGEWNRLADKPEFQKARAAVPMMAIWDNHDYGSHTGGKEFPLKDESQRIFLDFFNEPANSERRRTPGIYDARIFGPEGKQVQIILLDTRFFKDAYTKDSRSKRQRLKAGKVGGYVPDDNPSKTLLGAEQWVWLEEQFKKTADIRLIASSIQIIPDQKGMDEWGNFPVERQRLFELIKKTRAKGVIMVTGNVHFAEISQLKTFSYPLFDFTSSGLTHTNETYTRAKNAYRVAGPYGGENFGMIEIDWDAKHSPRITLKAISLDGSTAFEHTVSLDRLHE